MLKKIIRIARHREHAKGVLGFKLKQIHHQLQIYESHQQSHHPPLLILSSRSNHKSTSFF